MYDRPSSTLIKSTFHTTNTGLGRLWWLVASNVVLGFGTWSLVVLKDKMSVLGPVLGLEGLVLDPGFGLEGVVSAL